MRRATKRGPIVYIGLGIVLLVAGAILSFDVVTVDIQHVNEDTLGAILIAGGVLAIVLSLVLRDRVRHSTVVEDRPVVEDRRTL
jgi:uncharacterized membrane protein HdeD (DUF308 family)